MLDLPKWGTPYFCTNRANRMYFEFVATVFTIPYTTFMERCLPEIGDFLRKIVFWPIFGGFGFGALWPLNAVIYHRNHLAGCRVVWDIIRQNRTNGLTCRPIGTSKEKGRYKQSCFLTFHHLLRSLCRPICTKYGMWGCLADIIYCVVLILWGVEICDIKEVSPLIQCCRYRAYSVIGTRN